MAFDEALAQRIHDLLDGESVNPMEMRGRPMAGWLLVAPEALADDDQLQLWVDRGVAHVRTLPPKE